MRILYIPHVVYTSLNLNAPLPPRLTLYWVVAEFPPDSLMEYKKQESARREQMLLLNGNAIGQ
jgi:hypothetical protein